MAEAGAPLFGARKGPFSFSARAAVYSPQRGDILHKNMKKFCRFRCFSLSLAGKGREDATVWMT